MDALDGNHQEAIPAVVGQRTPGCTRTWSKMISTAPRLCLSTSVTPPAEHRELFDAVSAFMGGTLFMGKTCSAFTAGVMAIGLQAGEIENSYLRSSGCSPS